MQPNETTPGAQPEPEIVPTNPNPQPEIITPTVISPTVTSPPVTPQPVVTPEATPVTTPTVGPSPLPTMSLPSSPTPAPHVVAWSADPTVGSDGASTRGLPKPALLGALGVLIIAIAGLGYYFGYYTNSSVLYGQALSNSGKGITQLTDQLTSKKAAKYAGYVGSGKYKVDAGDFTTDGKLTFKGDKKNAETTFDVGLGTSRLNVTARTIKSTGNSPDIYLKSSGLAAASGMLGPDFAPIAAKYDDKWIVIDHTLLDNIQKQASKDNSGMPPTSEQVLDEVHMFNKVNQGYLFSDNKNTSVTKVLKTYGMETVDGHKVIHYQVGLDKANTKKYIGAQFDGVKATKLYDWIKQNKYESALAEARKSAIKDTDTIKSTDTFDMYADVNSRLIYKLRFADEKNPALNYVDVGLDTIHNNQLPFFVIGKDGTSKSTFAVHLTANTKTDELTFTLAMQGTGTNKFSASSDFTFKPSNSPVTVETPTGAIQLAEVFKDLGLGDPLSTLSGSAGNGGGLFGGTQSKATDTKRKTDVAYLQTSLEEYAANNNGYYPTLAQINDPAWRKKNFNSFDNSALTDPEGNGAVLTAVPSAKAYAYQPVNSQGQTCTNQGTNICRNYTLTALLANGAPYAKGSLY